MLPDTTIKRLNSLSSIVKDGKKVNGLMRLIENPILWKQAYVNIASNKGAVTKGVNNNTLDGFSEERINKLISCLKNGNYEFTPVRRTYIPKKNGKQRPLGIPTGDDKLVQEVFRIVLEQLYEGCFSKYSHGFRPNYSCHTALTQVHDTWTGTKWIIVMDIKGFFDNINHDVMMNVLKKRIDDKRFLDVIHNMLKAGYMENWKFNKTFSGTPQGGVISPILANIYLNELDEYVDMLRNSFNKGKERRINPEYQQYTTRIQVLRMREERVLKRLASIPELEKELEEATLIRERIRVERGSNDKEWRHYVQRMVTLRGQIDKIKKEASEEELQKIRSERKELQALKSSIPYGDPYDKDYKRLNYCRYADDFILGVIGSKEDAKEIAQNIRNYIEDMLELEIEDDKSKIVHADEGVSFLGYTVQSYDKPIATGCVVNGKKTTMRSSGRIQLIIPNIKLNEFCNKNAYGDLFSHKPASRGYLTCHSDYEIICTYNAELRGIVNYYSLGLNHHKKLEPLVSLARTSCAMTLAHKHRTSTTKIIKSMKRANGEWMRDIPIGNDVKSVKLYRLCTDDTSKRRWGYDVDNLPDTAMFTLSRTELIQRLEAKQCEVCGTTENVEVHHIRALKDIANSKSLYDQMMIARNRKTLVLCSVCHHKLHKGH